MSEDYAGSNVLDIGYDTGTSTAENQFVTFQISDEEYGIDIMLVQEIIRYKKPTKVFNNNPVIKGVINFANTGRAGDVNLG